MSFVCDVLKMKFTTLGQNELEMKTIEKLRCEC